MADEVASLKVLITGDVSDLESAIQKTKTSLDDLGNAGQKIGDKIEKGPKKATKSYKELSGALKDTGDSINTFTKPIQIASVALAAGGVAAAKFAIDFEDSFAAVKKTVDGTPEQIEAIKKGIIDLSTVGINGRSAIPMTTTELNELASAAGQLGVEVENVVEFTEVTAQMGTATNLVGSEGAATMARFLNVMGLGNDVVRNLGSAIVDLGNNSATTEQEIADMALRMGKFGNTVGMGAADVLGYSAALSSMGIEAQAGGSAVGRTWLAIESAVASGGAELSAFAKYSGKSAADFAKEWRTNSKAAFNSLLGGMKEGTKAGTKLVTMLDDLGINNTLDQQAMMALVNGFEQVGESVERANKAWEENSALQTEFNSKAETTASQLAIAKNNIVETARSIGETFLPDIAEASGSVAEFAKGLSQMSDSQKEALITTGKWVIGLGAASKVTAGTLKGAGNMIEAYGKLKTAFSAGGALASWGPALGSVASAAAPAAAGLAAVGLAVYAGKKAYDTWYDSNYRFAQDLEEGNEAIEKRATKLNTLDEAQNKLASAKLVINNPESSQEQVAKAKGEVERIAQLLADEYDLHINVDAPDLPGTVEVVENAINSMSDAEWADQRINFVDQVEILTDDREKANRDAAEIEMLRSAQQYESERHAKYKGLSADMAELNKSFSDGTISANDYREAVTNVAKSAGIGEDAIAGMADMSDETFGASVLSEINNVVTVSENGMTQYAQRIQDYDADIEKLKNGATSLANQLVESAGRYAEEDNLDQFFTNMRETIAAGELDVVGYAEVVQNTLSGMSLDTAIEAGVGSEQLTNWVSEYITVGKELGASVPDIVAKAALFSNGFKNAEEVTAESIPGIVSSMQELGRANGEELDATKLTEMARAIGLIPDNKQIEISAEGDISVVDAVVEKITELETKGGVKVKVDAEGNVEVLDKAGEQISYLEGIGAVSLRLNAEGNIEALDEAGNVVQTISENSDQNIEIAVNANTDNAKATIADLNGEKVEVPVGANVDEAETTIDSLNGRTVTVTVNGKIGTISNAKGTSDFPGGLAMINDERGVSDPRELVEIDGKGYIFEGKDVVLPLPEHAKVYTASQTKAIMSGQGIPHYAKGHNNEAWDTAKSEWQHYTRTNNVSVAEQIAHWNEMLETFANDADAVKEIYEELFSWQKKQSETALKEANEASNEWVESTNALRTWTEQGENMIDAFIRVRDRNNQAVQDGVQEEKEALKEIQSFTESMLSGRVQATIDYIERERSMRGMSFVEQKAQLASTKAEIDAFFASLGPLTAEEQVIKMSVYAELDDAAFDIIDEEIASWEQDAALYLKESQTLGWDWKNDGDSEVAYYQRMQQQYQDVLDYGGLNDEQYRAVLTKRREAELNAYTAAEAEYNEMLQERLDEISELQAEFADNISELRATWSTEDRQADIADVKKQLKIYEGAVTKEGREEYERLQEELKQLEREEEIYKLEQENNATIEKLEEEYERLEADKLKGISDLLKDADNLKYYSNSISASTDSIGEKLGDIQKTDLPGIISGLKGVSELLTGIKEIFEKQPLGVTNNNTFNIESNESDNFLQAGLKKILFSLNGGR